MKPPSPRERKKNFYSTHSPLSHSSFVPGQYFFYSCNQARFAPGTAHHLKHAHLFIDLLIRRLSLPMPSTEPELRSPLFSLAQEYLLLLVLVDAVRLTVLGLPPPPPPPLVRNRLPGPFCLRLALEGCGYSPRA